MTTFDRRGFLRIASSGALAAMMPGTIRRALAIPANNATGTIADVEHIVILMQENRSFDHYFGTLRGVRGFGDPRAVFQRDGKSIFSQPHEGRHITPFRPDATDPGAQFIEDLPHDWNTTQQAFNGGAWDRWIAAKGTTTMAHLSREDLPFHFALADAFTICDAYHCSVLGPTDPNRHYLWTGCTGNVGTTDPVVDNSEASYAWSTFPERLERAGISWNIYQDVGRGLDAANYWGWTSDANIGNYGDNPLLYFRQYQNAQPGDALYERARRGTRALHDDDLFTQFRNDVANGSLPQVSWIVAPEAFSEHPNWPAEFGAWYVSRILDSLTSNPEVWSKTVFLVTYDENDGFFDHVPPPFAPPSRVKGVSTIATDDESYPGNNVWVPGPYGLGPRVPMLAISPWSRGGYVNSQVFDHTSIIRFIERRFEKDHPDLIETNISAWRRAVCGDLTSAFDFAQPNASVPPLPEMRAPAPARLLRQPGYAPVPRGDVAMPTQEPGQRPSRAMPYRIDTTASRSNRTMRLTFQNSGEAAAVFQVRSRTHDGGPWVFTVGSGAVVAESWDIGDLGGYEFSVHGPHGFMRRFANAVDDMEVHVELHIDAEREQIRVAFFNATDVPRQLVVKDAYTGDTKTYTLSPAARADSLWDIAATQRWYDLRIIDSDDVGFRRQFAGHVENGRDSHSDPAIGIGTVADDDF